MIVRSLPWMQAGYRGRDVDADVGDHRRCTGEGNGGQSVTAA